MPSEKEPPRATTEDTASTSTHSSADGPWLRHQLNNQLGIILAQCEMLLESLQKRPAEAARVKSIKEVVRRISRLLNDETEGRRLLDGKTTSEGR